MGIILFAIGVAGLVMLFYGLFCYAPSEKNKSEKADRCVSCGEIIPEGRWVCPNCERKAKGKNDGK